MTVNITVSKRLKVNGHGVSVIGKGISTKDYFSVGVGEERRNAEYFVKLKTKCHIFA